MIHGPADSTVQGQRRGQTRVAYLLEAPRGLKSAP